MQSINDNIFIIIWQQCQINHRIHQRLRWRRPHAPRPRPATPRGPIRRYETGDLLLSEAGNFNIPLRPMGTKEASAARKKSSASYEKPRYCPTPRETILPWLEKIVEWSPAGVWPGTPPDARLLLSSWNILPRAGQQELLYRLLKWAGLGFTSWVDLILKSMLLKTFLWDVVFRLSSTSGIIYFGHPLMIM